VSSYHPPVDEHEDVIKAALRVIASTHYQRADDPHADAEQEYAEEQLALAARALARAVDRRDPDRQPIGWVEPEAAEGAGCPAGLLPLDDLTAPVERCIVRGKHDAHETAEGRKWTDSDSALKEELTA